MGSIKTDVYDESEIALSAKIRAIAHPARVHILQYLQENGPGSQNRLAAELKLAQSTVSKHLHELIEVGALYTKQSGYFTMYHLHYQNIREIRISINQFLVGLQEHNR